MGVMSGQPVTITAADIDQIVDEVWDELTADHVVAGSVGLSVRRIKDSAIAAGDTANSIAQKLRGMTDNQAVASSGGATVAAIWDELISNARVAASLGQRLKDAVALDTFTAARITDITKISSAAIAVGDTANSLAQKLRGMTDNQAVSSLTAANIDTELDKYLLSNTFESSSEVAPTSAGADTKGSWVELIASTARRYNYLLILIRSETATPIYKIDIGTGAAASEAVLIADLRLKMTSNAGQTSMAYMVKCGIAASTRLSTRTTNDGGGAGDIKVKVIGIG